MTRERAREEEEDGVLTAVVRDTNSARVRVVLSDEGNLAASYIEAHCQHTASRCGRFELGDVLKGNSVLLAMPPFEPHGPMLSVSDDQERSGGHMKAAGPMSVAAMAPAAARTTSLREGAMSVRSGTRAT